MKFLLMLFILSSASYGDNHDGRDVPWSRPTDNSPSDGLRVGGQAAWTKYKRSVGTYDVTIEAIDRAKNTAIIQVNTDDIAYRSNGVWDWNWDEELAKLQPRSNSMVGQVRKVPLSELEAAHLHDGDYRLGDTVEYRRQSVKVTGVSENMVRVAIPEEHLLHPSYDAAANLFSLGIYSLASERETYWVTKNTWVKKSAVKSR